MATPYARRMTAAGLAAAAIAATGYATHPGHADARTRTPPERIAPGGNIRTVVTATRRLGWPHEPQRAEMVSVARLALWYGVEMFGDSGSVRCTFGPAMGRARCATVARHGRDVLRFSQVFRIWEDGSYRVTPTPYPD